MASLGLMVIPGELEGESPRGIIKVSLVLDVRGNTEGTVYNGRKHSMLRRSMQLSSRIEYSNLD